MTCLVHAAARRDPGACERQRGVRGDRVVVVVVAQHPDPSSSAAIAAISRSTGLTRCEMPGALASSACAVSAVFAASVVSGACLSASSSLAMAANSWLLLGAVAHLQQRRRAAPQLAGHERQPRISCVEGRSGGRRWIGAHTEWSISRLPGRSRSTVDPAVLADLVRRVHVDPLSRAQPLRPAGGGALPGGPRRRVGFQLRAAAPCAPRITSSPNPHALTAATAARRAPHARAASR